MSFPVPLPSTFMPLPLAIMIPFMGMQSGVMAQQFGMNFQYGKRKISAMSNEEFNKLTPQQMQADFATQIKGFIPTFEQSLKDMRPFQRMIFVEMLAAFKEAIQLGLDVGGAGLGIRPPGSPEIPKEDLTHSFLSPVQQRAHIRHGHREEIENRYGKPQPIPQPTPTTTRQQQIIDFGSTQLNIPKVAVKRKAGQSQILARNQFIQDIARFGRIIKQGPEGGKGYKSYKFSLTAIKDRQQKLVNLLARYRF